MDYRRPADACTITFILDKIRAATGEKSFSHVRISITIETVAGLELKFDLLSRPVQNCLAESHEIEVRRISDSSVRNFIRTVAKSVRIVATAEVTASEFLETGIEARLFASSSLVRLRVTAFIAVQRKFLNWVIYV